MNNNLTEIVFILDRSGSMAGLEDDTIGGFNAMVEKQKKEQGEALLSAVLFSDGNQVIYDRVDIQKVEPIPFAAGRYRPKPLHTIIAGLITLESNWANPLGDSLRKNLRKLEKERQINIGCALKNGSFCVEYEPKFSLKKSAPDESLLFFFLRLLMMLQNIGTVPAINIEEYAKALQSFEDDSD